jgi:putative ABC transport system ATP-binding protein
MKTSFQERNSVAIQLDDVHKAYRRGSTSTPVLSGVDLEVERGECVFLAGPSGSGKSTLLSIIGCILSADRGVVRVLGHDVARLSSKRRARLRLAKIGFVFQRFHLVRGLTALENVCVPMMLADAFTDDARERAAQLLKILGLADKLRSHPRKLSTGQCQRVALARALANDPELILADEPTASLDAANGRQIMELLRCLATDHGKAVVVVTHDTRIFSYAHRVCWLENGQITDGNRHEESAVEFAASTAAIVTDRVAPVGGHRPQ